MVESHPSPYLLASDSAGSALDENFRDNRVADAAAVDTAATTAAALSVSVGKPVELNLKGLAPEAVSLVKDSSRNIEAALINSWTQVSEEDEREDDNNYYEDQGGHGGDIVMGLGQGMCRRPFLFAQHKLVTDSTRNC